MGRDDRRCEVIAKAMPTAVNAVNAELVLLIAGIIFTIVVAGIFGTVIWRALRAEKRAEAERRAMIEQFRAEQEGDAES